MLLQNLSVELLNSFLSSSIWLVQVLIILDIVLMLIFLLYLSLNFVIKTLSWLYFLVHIWCLNLLSLCSPTNLLHQQVLSLTQNYCQLLSSYIIDQSYKIHLISNIWYFHQWINYLLFVIFMLSHILIVIITVMTMILDLSLVMCISLIVLSIIHLLFISLLMPIFTILIINLYLTYITNIMLPF